VILLALVLAVSAAEPSPGLVDLAEVLPRAVLDLRYATPHNFLKEAVYAHPRCLLRAEVAHALATAELQLEAKGYRLLLWDCYRPLSVQRAMWKRVPVKGLVADPEHGGSHHNRGTAVDAALADLEGKPVAMCTDHDDFSRAGRRDAPCAPEPAARRAALRQALEAAGFTTIRTEWWHFDAPNAGAAPLLDQPL
jgi:D-alanyl-D-alanine dipeptidase